MRRKLANERVRKYPPTKGLTFRMAYLVVAAALCIGLILSIVQILLDYREEKLTISTKFDELIASVKPAAEVAIYEVDAELTKQIALGLLENKAIIRVTVHDNLAGDLIDVSKPIPYSNFEWLTRLLFGDIVQKTVPLSDIKRKDVITGALLIVLDPNHFTSDFLQRAALILISGFIRNTILALVTFYLFYHLLTNPLQLIARDIASINPENPGEKPVSVPRGHEADELGELICVFNDMDQSLQSAQQKLQAYNRELELKVEERTAELMIANTQLKHEVKQRKQSEEQFRILSHYDVLTGLYNRNYFEEEILRLKGGRNLPLGIIICDVDNLKLINDRLGHDSGDKLIQRAANIIKSSFREGDMVARIGGDEFVALLPDSDNGIVNQGVQRIRETIENENSECNSLPISISIGHSICTEKPLQFEALFKEADNLMYKDKAAHKDKYHKELIFKMDGMRDR